MFWVTMERSRAAEMAVAENKPFVSGVEGKSNADQLPSDDEMFLLTKSVLEAPTQILIFILIHIPVIYQG